MAACIRSFAFVVGALSMTTAALLPSPADAQVIWGDSRNELSPEDRARLDALRQSQAEAKAKEDAKAIAEAQAVRAKVLRLPPLPPERNPLLGQWKVETQARARGDAALLADMLSKPGGFMCELMFGPAVEFRPKEWVVSGGKTLVAVQYRSEGKRVLMIPEKFVSSGLSVFIFDFVNENRVGAMYEGCFLNRVGGSAQAAQGAGGSRAPAGSSTAAPPTQMASAAQAPPPSTPSPPPAEACRNTLLDKLGKVGVDQVRAMAKVRYTETPIEGKVPNTDNLRLDLRSSACGEDPRIKASLYDFDANGMLQSITYVWDRPPGPAPAPIFAERVTALSRFYPSLPQPQSIGRLQGDTALGRLILQDMPERNLLLEAYKAKQ